MQPHQSQPLEPHLLRILQRLVGWISRSRPVVLATLYFFSNVATACMRCSRVCDALLRCHEQSRVRANVIVLATLAAYSAVGDARRVIPSLLGCMV